MLVIQTDDDHDEFDGPTTNHLEIILRITFTDQYSDEEDNSVSDTFLLIIKNKCSANALTMTESLGVLRYYVTDSAQTYSMTFSGN